MVRGENIQNHGQTKAILESLITQAFNFIRVNPGNIRKKQPNPDEISDYVDTGLTEHLISEGLISKDYGAVLSGNRERVLFFNLGNYNLVVYNTSCDTDQPLQNINVNIEGRMDLPSIRYRLFPIMTNGEFKTARSNLEPGQIAFIPSAESMDDALSRDCWHTYFEEGGDGFGLLYQFQPDGSGIYQLNTFGPPIDTLKEVKRISDFGKTPDERSSKILSGSLITGALSRSEKEKLLSHPPGSFYVEHFNPELYSGPTKSIVEVFDPIAIGGSKYTLKVGGFFKHRNWERLDQ